MKVIELIDSLNQLIADELSVSVELIDTQEANEKFDADLAAPLFKAAKELSKNPIQLAEELSAKLEHDFAIEFKAASGYLNIYLDSEKLGREVLAYDEHFAESKLRNGKEVLVEFTDPNPFKEFHIGHLYSNTIGEAICRLYETSGANVRRLSYHGDVGRHIAMAVWGIKNSLGNKMLEDIEPEERASFLGQAYALGAKAFADNEEAKQEIIELNKQLYALDDPELTEIYKTGRSWSFEYFQTIYERIGASFDKQYFESETGPKGVDLVSSLVGEVFKESEGAVVFEGEEHGLHTRVFINSQGLPTYEAKDLALVHLKEEDFPDAEQSIVITANEQNAYFKVMLKALEQFAPELASKTTHIGHGEVVLPSGKMSSRTGDVITAVNLIDTVKTSVEEKNDNRESSEEVALAAIKYAFLKQNIGGNVVYDVEESIALEGQTGPYIQYAAVRIKSILNKIKTSQTADSDYDFKAEHKLLRSIYLYPLAVERATADLAPQIVAQYVYTFAKELNRYYENVNIKESEEEIKAIRLEVLKAAHYLFEHSARVMNIALPQVM